MTLNHYDVDLMKIIGWCKNVPAGMNRYFSSRAFAPEVVKTLASAGIVYGDKKNGGCRLRPAGYRLLKSAGFDFPRDAKPRCEKDVVSRRCGSALVLATFYTAGIDPFSGSRAALRQEQAYLPSFTFRRGKFSQENIANSTVFRGIYRVRDTAYIVYYVQDPEEKVSFSNELKTFNQIIANTGVEKTALIFMGNTYEAIEKAAFYDHGGKETQDGAGSIDSYSAVYKNTSLPVYFIPVGDKGAQVLKAMQLPDYREEIARAVMRGSYKPPYADVPGTDTVHNLAPNNPAVFALDMDIKRIDKAYDTAVKQGFERLALFVLNSQKDFITARYKDTKKADVFYIPVDVLNGIFKDRFNLAGSSMKPYATPEGRYADVTFAPPQGKAGDKGQARHDKF